MLYLYVVCVFILILNGIYAWPCLGFSDYGLIFIHTMTLLSGCVISNKIKPANKLTLLYVIVLLSSNLLLAKGINGTIIKSSLFVIILMQIFSFKKSLTKKILDLLNILFFCVIIVSTVLFVFYSVGFPVPNFGVINYYQYILSNHLFFVSNLDYNSIRFYGFCVEPGYFALLLSCLICANNYEINKFNIVYLVALLCTLSLGGLLITGFGWYLHYVLSKGVTPYVIFKRSVSFILIILLVLIILPKLGAIGEVFSDNIIGRLQFDPEKGIAGNNRINERFDMFWLSFLLSDKMLWGMGASEYFASIDGLELDGASYRVFVMQYGVIFTIIFLTIFCLFTKSLGNKKYILPIVSIYVLDFLQHGTPFQGVFLILYLLMSYYQEDSLCERVTRTV